jgi:hypothetical protein
VDTGFNVTGYMWVAAWFLIFSVDQVYIKHIVDTIQAGHPVASRSAECAPPQRRLGRLGLWIKRRSGVPNCLPAYARLTGLWEWFARS